MPEVIEQIREIKVLPACISWQLNGEEAVPEIVRQARLYPRPII